MGKTKKFINKKQSATFQLLARDTSDPNYGSGPSGDRVFVRVDTNPYTLSNNDDDDDAVSSELDPNSIFADAPYDYDDGGDGFGRSGNETVPFEESVRREILELGFPDDGYNYLVHLRDIKNTGGGSAYYENPKANLHQLPRDVKAYNVLRLDISKVNDDSNEKSIYNVASKSVGVKIQKAVDPEVAALLDDSDLSRFGSDFEDLEEDFVVMANLPEGPVNGHVVNELSLMEKFEVGKGKSSGLNTCSKENVAEFDGVNEVRNHMLDAPEACIDDENPRVRRLLDEQFDLLELQEYGTNSEDECDGPIAEEYECHESLAEKLNDVFKNHAMDDMELDDGYKAPSDLLHDINKARDIDSLKCAADVIHRCREYAEKYENENQDEDVVVIDESSDESEVWDCETIISTYSNLDNIPAKIEAPEIRRKKLAETVSRAFNSPNHVISLKGKGKLPVDFLPYGRKSASEKVKDVSCLRTELLKRKQHGQESKEEKKERKAATKEERREARRAKKEMKGIYRCEAHRAQKVAASAVPSSIHLM